MADIDPHAERGDGPDFDFDQAMEQLNIVPSLPDPTPGQAPPLRLPYPRIPAPSMDATMRAPDGTTIRAAQIGGDLHLTIAGEDGGVTVVLDKANASLLSSLLGRAAEARRGF